MKRYDMKRYDSGVLDSMPDLEHTVILVVGLEAGQRLHDLPNIGAEQLTDHFKNQADEKGETLENVLVKSLISLFVVANHEDLNLGSLYIRYMKSYEDTEIQQ